MTYVYMCTRRAAALSLSVRSERAWSNLSRSLTRTVRGEIVSRLAGLRARVSCGALRVCVRRAERTRQERKLWCSSVLTTTIHVYYYIICTRVCLCTCWRCLYNVWCAAFYARTLINLYSGKSVTVHGGASICPQYIYKFRRVFCVGTGTTFGHAERTFAFEHVSSVCVCVWRVSSRVLATRPKQQPGNLTRTLTCVIESW